MLAAEENAMDQKTNIRPGIDHVAISVVFMCHDGKGNFAMAFRKDTCRDEKNRWDIGGGKVDFGDTVEDTLRSEILQEYQADVIEAEFLGYRDAIRTDEEILRHWIALDFLVLVDPAQVGNGEPHKFEKVEWHTPSDYPKNCHSQFPRFIELHKDKLKERGLAF